MQVKNSWQKQESNKELATRLLITKKVQRAVAPRRNDIQAVPIENEYEDTLDDLLDDPDFTEVMFFPIIEKLN